jgi:hypothetical protein
MQLKAALGLSQILSLIVFLTLARWYLVPWLKTLDRAGALIVLLWPHVFRYVALQAYSAQHAGFPISDAGLRNIVYGDLGGMLLAMAAIVALRHRARAAIPMIWALVAATLIDTVLNISSGIREHLYGAATGVTWMVVSFYVPLLMVTLGLTIWQLYSRRNEWLDESASPGTQPAGRVRLVG